MAKKRLKRGKFSYLDGYRLSWTAPLLRVLQSGPPSVSRRRKNTLPHTLAFFDEGRRRVKERKKVPYRGGYPGGRKLLARGRTAEGEGESTTPTAIQRFRPMAKAIAAGSIPASCCYCCCSFLLCLFFPCCCCSVSIHEKLSDILSHSTRALTRDQLICVQ